MDFRRLNYYKVRPEAMRAMRGLGQLQAQGAIEHGFASLLGHMRRHRRTYASHLLGFSFLALVFNAALNWYPAFLMRVFQLTAARAGFLIGLVVLVTLFLLTR